MFSKVIFSRIYNFCIIFLKAMMFIMIAYKKQIKEYKARVNLFFFKFFYYVNNKYIGCHELFSG